MSYFHLVLGTGPLGLATARALLERGHGVVLVNRAGRIADLPVGATIATGDLSELSTLRRRAQGAAAIHFCVQPPYHRWPEEFPALQDAAVTLAADSGAKLVVAENLYGYGPVDGPMTEDAQLAATTRKGAARAAMHRSLLAARDAGRVEVAVARGSDFFGPGVINASLGAETLKHVIEGRRARVLGDPDLPHSYTYVADFGTAMAILAVDPRANGEVFHVPNAPATSTRTLLAELATLAGRELRLTAIAPWQVRLLAMGIRPLRELVELTYQVTQPFIVDHGKFAALFGDIATPREQALAATMRSIMPQQERIPAAA